MLLPSKGSSVARIDTADDPGANDMPSALRARDLILVGCEPTTPVAFHIRYGWPLESTNGCGSIDPTGSESPTSRDGLKSMKGPAGEVARATEMPRRPGSTSHAVEAPNAP